jgi:hypothetical protein
VDHDLFEGASAGLLDRVLRAVAAAPGASIDVAASRLIGAILVRLADKSADELVESFLEGLGATELVLRLVPASAEQAERGPSLPSAQAIREALAAAPLWHVVELRTPSASDESEPLLRLNPSGEPHFTFPGSSAAAVVHASEVVPSEIGAPGPSGRAEPASASRAPVVDEGALARRVAQLLYSELAPLVSAGPQAASQQLSATEVASAVAAQLSHLSPASTVVDDVADAVAGRLSHVSPANMADAVADRLSHLSAAALAEEVAAAIASRVPVVSPAEVADAVALRVPALSPADVADAVANRVPVVSPAEVADAVANRVPAVSPADVAEAVALRVPALSPGDIAEAVARRVPQVLPAEVAETVARRLPPLSAADVAEAVARRVPQLSQHDVAEAVAERVLAAFSSRLVMGTELAEILQRSYPDPAELAAALAREVGSPREAAEAVAAQLHADLSALSDKLADDAARSAQLAAAELAAALHRLEQQLAAVQEQGRTDRQAVAAFVDEVSKVARRSREQVDAVTAEFTRVVERNARRNGEASDRPDGPRSSGERLAGSEWSA